MIVKFKDVFVINFGFLKAENIKTIHPNVNDEDPYSSPSWKISRKNSIILDTQFLILNNKDQNPDTDDSSSYSN